MSVEDRVPFVVDDLAFTDRLVQGAGLSDRRCSMSTVRRVAACSSLGGHHGDDSVEAPLGTRPSGILRKAEGLQAFGDAGLWGQGLTRA